MPREGKKEIAITPSLAKKLTNEIQSLIEKKLTLQYNEQVHAFIISGVLTQVTMIFCQRRYRKTALCRNISASQLRHFL